MSSEILSCSIGVVALTNARLTLWSRSLIEDKVMRDIAAVLLGLVATCLTGCGTFGNFTPLNERTPPETMKRVYGGVRFDAGEHAEYAVHPCTPIERQYPLWPAIRIGLLTGDLPFSFIGDTITLPYTLALFC
jgi:uncharacterized protein YceK